MANEETITIDKLTPEQEAAMPKYVEKWTAIGLATGPADQAKCRELVPKIYEAAGLTPPDPNNYIFARSPVDAVLKICAEIDEPPSSKYVDDMIYGNQDCAWLALYDFFLNELDIKVCEKLVPLMQFAECAGWWSPYNNAVVIQDRPEEIHMDEAGRLHNIKGMAIRYSDGYGVYCYHNVPVPDWIIETPEKITVAAIESEANVEIRRAMIEIYGEERYIMDSGAIEVHSDDWGTLYKKEITGDETIMMVKVVNSTPEPDGSFKDYFIRVHPELRPMLDTGEYGDPQELTAKNAVASTFGLTGDTYKPLIQT